MSLEERKRRDREVSRSSSDYLANPNKPARVEKLKKEDKSKLQRLELKMKIDARHKEEKEKGGPKRTAGSQEEAKREVMSAQSKTDAKEQTKKAEKEKQKQDVQLQMEKASSSSA